MNIKYPHLNENLAIWFNTAWFLFVLLCFLIDWWFFKIFNILVVRNLFFRLWTCFIIPDIIQIEIIIRFVFVFRIIFSDIFICFHYITCSFLDCFIFAVNFSNWLNFFLDFNFSILLILMLNHYWSLYICADFHNKIFKIRLSFDYVLTLLNSWWLFQ